MSALIDWAISDNRDVVYLVTIETPEGVYRFGTKHYETGPSDTPASAQFIERIQSFAPQWSLSSAFDGGHRVTWGELSIDNSDGAYNPRHMAGDITILMGDASWDVSEFELVMTGKILPLRQTDSTISFLLTDKTAELDKPASALLVGRGERGTERLNEVWGETNSVELKPYSWQEETGNNASTVELLGTVTIVSTELTTPYADYIGKFVKVEHASGWSIPHRITGYINLGSTTVFSVSPPPATSTSSTNWSIISDVRYGLVGPVEEIPFVDIFTEDDENNDVTMNLTGPIAYIESKLPATQPVIAGVKGKKVGGSYLSTVGELMQGILTKTTDSVMGIAQQSSTTTIIYLDNLASGVDDYYNGTTLTVYGAGNTEESRTISDYDGEYRKATVSSAFSTAAEGRVYKVAKTGHPWAPFTSSDMDSDAFDDLDTIYPNDLGAVALDSTTIFGLLSQLCVSSMVFYGPKRDGTITAERFPLPSEKTPTAAIPAHVITSKLDYNCMEVVHTVDVYHDQKAFSLEAITDWLLGFLDGSVDVGYSPWMNPKKNESILRSANGMSETKKITVWDAAIYAAHPYGRVVSKQTSWLNKSSAIDLGERILEVFGVPGREVILTLDCAPVFELGQVLTINFMDGDNNYTANGTIIGMTDGINSVQLRLVVFLAADVVTVEADTTVLIPPYKSIWTMLPPRLRDPFNNGAIT